MEAKPIPIYQNDLEQLDAKAKKYTMVGYCEHTKGYRLVDPREPKKLIKAWDVIFIDKYDKEKEDK